MALSASIAGLRCIHSTHRHRNPLQAAFPQTRSPPAAPAAPAMLSSCIATSAASGGCLDTRCRAPDQGAAAAACAACWFAAPLPTMACPVQFTCLPHSHHPSLQTLCSGALAAAAAQQQQAPQQQRPSGGDATPPPRGGRDARGAAGRRRPGRRHEAHGQAAGGQPASGGPHLAADRHRGRHRHRRAGGQGSPGAGEAGMRVSDRVRSHDVSCHAGSAPAVLPLACTPAQGLPRALPPSSRPPFPPHLSAGIEPSLPLL